MTSSGEFSLLSLNVDGLDTRINTCQTVSSEWANASAITRMVISTFTTGGAPVEITLVPSVSENVLVEIVPKEGAGVTVSREYRSHAASPPPPPAFPLPPALPPSRKHKNNRHKHHDSDDSDDSDEGHYEMGLHEAKVYTVTRIILPNLVEVQTSSWSSGSSDGGQYLNLMIQIPGNLPILGKKMHADGLCGRLSFNGTDYVSSSADLSKH
eukprot:gene25591-31279_t